MKFIILLILPLIFLTYGIQNIPEIDARSATEPCSYQKSNSFLKISNEPWTCKKVDYWVPERCGIHEGIYKTDVACQKPAPVAPAPVAPAPVAPAPVAPAPVAPAPVAPAPIPVPEIQDSESPNNWLIIAGIAIVFVIGGVIYKKFLNPKVGGYQKYTGSKEKPEDESGFEKESQQKSDFNYYEILGASRDDTQEEIKQKYKELSLKFHPDKAKSALSENMMKQINEAYAVLRDIDKRRQYDAKLDSA